MTRRLTAADVCAVTGYSRDELHALLRVLAPYSLQRPTARVAREFAALDLVVLSVTQILEDRYGLRRAAVAQLGSQLQQALGGPRLAAEHACLFVSVNPAQVELREDAAGPGLNILLAPIFDKVDAYLSYDPQLPLQFGPALVSRKYG